MSYSDILALKHLGDKGYRNPLLQQNKALVKSAGGVLYLDARKATGTGKTTDVNSPFVDLSNRVGKNLCDGIFESGGIGASTGANFVDATLIRTKNYFGVLSNTTYFASNNKNYGGAIYWYDTNKNFISNTNINAGGNNSPTNAAFARVRFTGTDLTTQIQVEKGSQTAYEPYALNNATLTNFAGTTSSGYDISDPIRPFLRFDGTDDYGALVNTPSIDITSAPLAVFATVKFSSALFMWVIAKNLDSAANMQYGMQYDSTYKRIVPYLENTTYGYSATNSADLNIWYNVGFIWDGINVKCYINRVQNGAIQAYSGALTSRPNVRIGRRETTAGHFKGDLATLTIYAGAKATEANILKAERSLSKAYIGG